MINKILGTRLQKKLPLINNEFNHTTNNNSIQENLHPVSFLLGLFTQA